MKKIAPELKTARLTLRAAEIGDAADVFAWSSSKTATKYLFWLPHRTEKDAQRLVTDWVKRRRHFSWLLISEGKAIGEIEDIKDLPDQGFMVGYILNPAYWKKGFMSEALEAVLAYQKTLGYSYAEAETDERNESSIRLLTRNGFLPFGEAEERYIAKKKETVRILHFRKELH
jgi:RimJ/RimL family protein N-acetyltransferase